MNVLDENIRAEQRERLRKGRIRVRQIGHDIGRSGMSDAEIIPLLHQLNRSTFFTLDRHFYDRDLCHTAYCLIHLDVIDIEVASYVGRFLRLPAFSTFARRRGAVVRLGYDGVRSWRLHVPAEEELAWP